MKANPRAPDLPRYGVLFARIEFQIQSSSSKRPSSINHAIIAISPRSSVEPAESAEPGRLPHESACEIKERFRVRSVRRVA